MRTFGDGRLQVYHSSGSKTYISVVSSRPVLHLLAPCSENVALFRRGSRTDGSLLPLRMQQHRLPSVH